MKVSKKLLFCALPMLLLIISCSKNDNPIETPDENQKLFKVSFNVSGFTTDITPLPGLKSSAVNQSLTPTAAKLSDQISKLEYLIYNSSGQLVIDSVQTSNLSNFGAINLQLPAGNYKLIVAGMSGNYMIANNKNSTLVNIFGYLDYGIGDWFKQVTDFKVADQNLNQSVSLDRAVGKVGFVLTDAIPKNLAKITLAFTSGNWMFLNNENDPPTALQIIEFPMKPSREGELNFSSSAYVIPMANGFITTDVSIRAYNTFGNLIVEKIIKNVVIEKNKMTTLTGALFTSLPSSTDTNVTINSEWKPSAIVNF